MKKLWLVILTLFIITSVSFFVGLTDTPDSFEYLSLGKYFHYKEITPLAPFSLDRPRTIMGPLYAILITPLFQLPVPWGAFGITFIQLVFVAINAFLLFKISGKFFSAPWPVMSALLYLFTPFTLVYATFMMSEILTQFLVVLFLYTLVHVNKHNATKTFSRLTLISALTALTRFGFILMFIGSFIGWIASLKRGRIVYTSWLPGFVGSFIILLWILFNYQINGVLSISTYTGRHIYNSVVFEGKILPDENDKALMPFRIGDDYQFYMTNAPWWDIQTWFSTSGLQEPEVDRLFFDVSLAAIRTHPILYLTHVLRSMYLIPTAIPYLRDNIVTDFRTCQYAQCLNCVPSEWNNYTCWKSPLCTPPIKNCTAQSLWADIISLQQKVYPIFPAILIFISFIGALRSFFSKQIMIKWIAVLFISLLAFHAGTEMIEGRFIIPLYPFVTILFVYTLSRTFSHK